MRYLSGNDAEEAMHYLNLAAGIAEKATCERHKCGSIVVAEGKVIGTGFNSPPADLGSQRRCSYSKDSYDKRVTDKTCCMHAEQRAVFDSLKNNPGKINGSRLYFIRLDEDGGMAKSGEPYCTICSKTALDCGIKEFILWHEAGICAYDTGEYNTLSYNYRDKR